MVETVAELFEITFKQMQIEREVEEVSILFSKPQYFLCVHECLYIYADIVSSTAIRFP